MPGRGKDYSFNKQPYLAGKTEIVKETCWSHHQPRWGESGGSGWLEQQLGISAVYND